MYSIVIENIMIIVHLKYIYNAPLNFFSNFPIHLPIHLRLPKFSIHLRHP